MILSFFNIRPNEGRLVALMILYYFFIGAAQVFTETAAFALFVDTFETQALPYVYMVTAVLLLLLAFVYLKLADRMSLGKFLSVNLGFLLLGSLALYLGLALMQLQNLAFILPIWFTALNNLSSLSFWNLADQLFDVRQGRRLFGLIDSGAWIACVAGGFLTPVLVTWLDVASLLLPAASSLALALYCQRVILRRYASHLTAPAEENAPRSGGQIRDISWLKNRYVRLIFSLIIWSWVGFYFVENIFYDRAEIQYPDAGQLAAFLGVFYAGMGILGLATDIFLAGRLIGRYGLWAAFLTTPVIVTAGIAVLAVSGTLAGDIVMLFWLAALAKLVNEGLFLSLDQASFAIFYQPLPASQRVQVRTMVEGIVQTLATALAAGLLLIFNTFLGFGAIQLSYLFLVIAVFWILTVGMLIKEYAVALSRALIQRRLGQATLVPLDRSSLAIFQQSLTSPHVGVVVYALDLLSEIAPEMLATALPPLLEHRAAEVRLEVLRRVEQLGLTALLPVIQRRMKAEGSAAVRGASLRVLATLGDAGMIDEVCTYLDHPDLYLRQGALVGLLRSGELDGILAAGEWLNDLIRSPSSMEREFAAQVLGEAGLTDLYRPLLKLLRDNTPQVQRVALAAAGKVKQPKLWPIVIEALASPKTRAAASAALIAGGEAVLPELSVAFREMSLNLSATHLDPMPREVVIRLARIYGRIRGTQAVALLQNLLNYPNGQVRFEVLVALNRCGYRAEGEAQRGVYQEIKVEVAHVAWTLAALADLDNQHDLTGREAIWLLQMALTHDLIQRQMRLFLWLSFLYNPHLIRQVQNTLSANQVSAEQRSYALEIIEVQVNPALKELLLPLFDDLTQAQRLQRLSRVFPQPRLDGLTRLREIIARPGTWFTPWTKACALYVIAHLSARELVEVVVSALTAPEPLVRETAVWTLFRLDPAQYNHYRGELGRDSNPQVARVVTQLVPTQKGDGLMLSTVEKVLRLKTIDFFTETPEEALADAASILEEIDIAAGITFLQKGEMDRSLYLIVDGQVRVHDGERKVADLGENDIFGELALLDPAPRLASVTALTDTRLFRLDQEPFYELLEDHSEIAQKLLQVLARRLRRAPAQTKSDRAAADLLGELQEKLSKKI